MERLEFKRGAIYKVLNFFNFQIAWFSCLLLEENWSIVITATILFLHQLFISHSPREWLFVLSLALVGSLVDSLFSILGVLNFAGQVVFIPLWLVCIWLVFATTLNHSFIWLKDRLFLAACLGAVGGPASYFAGTQFSDVSFSSSLWYSLSLIAVFWAILLPSSLYIAKKMSLSHSEYGLSHEQE